MSDIGGAGSLRELMPAAKGRQDFRRFAKSVKLDQRYFRSDDGNEFLMRVKDTCPAREQKIAAGTILWRARHGAKSEEVGISSNEKVQICGPGAVPYSAAEMKPLRINWTSEARVNPRGISCLYLATNRDTAVAEIRPWIGSDVSVGEFASARDLTVIDCSKHPKGIGNWLPWISKSREEGIWSAIDEAFAKPVDRNDEVSDYIPTQILGELFKSCGYDGVIYKSLLDEDGKNLALFSLDDADLMSCSLLTVTGVKFQYSDVTKSYQPIE